MSFINKLARGFVRSAVNQVGRDGGRVISNKVYGDSHSTPIRIIGSKNSNNSNITNDTENISSRADFASQGYKAVLLQSSPIGYFFMAIGSAILPLIGPLYWLYTSYTNFFKKYTKFYRIIQEPIYAEDRRFKTGERHDGFRNVKQFSIVAAKPQTSERIIFLLKGTIALIFALCIFSIQYSVYMSFTNQPEAEIEKVSTGYVTARDGLNLRKSNSSNADIIISIPFNDSVQILDVVPVEAKDSSSINWIKVKYHNKTGWVWKELINWK